MLQKLRRFQNVFICVQNVFLICHLIKSKGPQDSERAEEIVMQPKHQNSH